MRRLWAAGRWAAGPRLVPGEAHMQTRCAPAARTDAARRGPPVYLGTEADAGGLVPTLRLLATTLPKHHCRSSVTAARLDRKAHRVRLVGTVYIALVGTQVEKTCGATRIGNWTDDPLVRWRYVVGHKQNVLVGSEVYDERTHCAVRYFLRTA